MNNKEKLRFLQEEHHSENDYWSRAHPECMLELNGKSWFSDELYDILQDMSVEELKKGIEDLKKSPASQEPVSVSAAAEEVDLSPLEGKLSSLESRLLKLETMPAKKEVVVNNVPSSSKDDIRVVELTLNQRHFQRKLERHALVLEIFITVMILAMSYLILR